MHELDCGELVSSRWVIDVPEPADETSLSKRPKPPRYTSTLGKADVTEVVAALLKINAGIAGPSWSMLTICDGSSDELEIDAGDFKLRLEWSHDMPKGWVGVDELLAVLGDLEYRERGRAAS